MNVSRETPPPVYRVMGMLDDPIQGTFYAQELNRVQSEKKLNWKDFR